MTDAERFLADDPPFATPEEFAKVMKERDGEMRLIDADALKTELVHDYAYAAAIMVDKQPAIDPVRHARWVHYPDNNSHVVEADMCSECKNEYVFGDMYNYCPACGAKMDGAT